MGNVALRMKRMRARKRQGAMIVPVVVDPTFKDELVAAHLLPPDQKTDRAAVKEATQRLLTILAKENT
jgi:hypothetical protein